MITGKFVFSFKFGLIYQTAYGSIFGGLIYFCIFLYLTIFFYKVIKSINIKTDNNNTFHTSHLYLDMIYIDDTRENK